MRQRLVWQWRLLLLLRSDPLVNGVDSLAATALMILVGILVVVVGTLWAAPRVAPHLPASVAQHLMPGQMTTTAEVQALREQLAAATTAAEERRAALEARIAAAEGTLAEAGYTNVRDLTGHWQGWQAAGLPRE